MRIYGETRLVTNPPTYSRLFVDLGIAAQHTKSVKEPSAWADGLRVDGETVESLAN